MHNYECPYCGKEIEQYLDNIEVDDWTVIKARSCTDDDDVQCKGCSEITEISTEIQCEHCYEAVNMYCKYIQPCNENGFVLALQFTKI